MFIFIDDERNPADVKWVKLPKAPEWQVCRSYAGFVKLIESAKDPIIFVSFDHDLGLPTDGSTEKTGVDCAKALINVLCDKHWTMPGIQIHSQNPVGKQNIINTLATGEKWVKISSSKDLFAHERFGERK